MVSPSVKNLVRRLFADGEFRQGFLKTPEATLGDQSLSTEERRALLRLHARLATAGGPGQLQEDSPRIWP